MDALIRQIRTKYPTGEGSSATAARDQQLGPSRTQSFKGGGQDKEGNGSITRDQRLPPQKTQSFKGDKRRSQSWLRRQFSRQMSQDTDSGNAEEYEAAVAAAAFAVKSLEETKIRDERKGRHGQDTSIAKIKSKEPDTSRMPEPRAKSIKFSDEVSKPNMDAQDRKVQISSEKSEKKPESAGGLVSALKKKLSFTDAIASSPPESASPDEKTIGPLLPSIKKPPTSASKSFDKTPSRKPESPERKPDTSFQKRPQIQPVDTLRQSPTKPGVEDNTADAWEKSELTRIKEKYEKLNTTILDWETKKKKKAKRKLERIEAELDKRRAKAFEHYRIELARIDGIAGGARSQAIENRRNEEFKAKEKANKIRLTGKFPATCLCC